MRDVGYTTISDQPTMLGTAIVIRAHSAPRTAMADPITDSTPSAVAKGS